ncbi:hypothetical protein [Aggregatibacter actinomycetemcomitans]|uniref:hypothetical protein n=1 Tax=Aggregatibacter actinomycetemcomitans TaxID=714 RepID=UPI00077E92E6|nr:hypothetical protein [Aggregatibacter actinomycetemcomitans]KYK75305.1 hypothetical protein SA3096_03220 [Aggregatibacter actinomycetemcomitans serotype e str. SA3096]KYK77479.1 hypothetical protein SC936_10840 [Aggregatibacter actinomycetemcomitans serotype e str. SC936]MBN6059357.1 hypothetical protein [Aggregatibacter actinomycetemcomitans]MBN6087858.1 hypothetical protein [Aggregatibacter actinomycetemcomitans]TYA87501.1 hypothetical protein FXE09_08475 [Aggregatibacter actinomycetemcom
MTRLYKINENSPFFNHMQNTIVEDSLSDSEKQSLFSTIINGIVVTQLERFYFTDDEIQFLIYAGLNKRPPAETTDILMKNRLNNGDG